MAGELISIEADRLNISLDDLRYPLVCQTTLANVPPAVERTENRPIIGRQQLEPGKQCANWACIVMPAVRDPNDLSRGLRGIMQVDLHALTNKLQMAEVDGDQFRAPKRAG